MVHEDDSGSGPDRADRLARQSETITDGWERTLSDVKAMTADREERGYEVVTVPSGDTAPLSPGAGDTDRWGLSHLIPGSRVDPLLAVYEDGEFTETGVYQRTDAGHVFLVTECIDHESEAVVFIAGAYEMRDAPALVRKATETGTMYSHVRTLDRTYVATFEHDDASAFFPNPEEFYAYELPR